MSKILEHVENIHEVEEWGRAFVLDTAQNHAKNY